MYYMVKLILSLLVFFSSLSYADEKIDNLVKQLGAQTYKERKKAENELWALLPESEAALRKAAASDDPEINTRAKRVLGKYEKGILPGITDEVKEKIDSFWNAKKKSVYIRDWIYGSDFKDIPIIITVMKLAERRSETIQINELMSHRDFFSSLYLKYKGTKSYEYFIRKYAEQGVKGIYLNWVKSNSSPKAELAYYDAHKNKNSEYIKSIKQSLFKLSGNIEQLEKLVAGDFKNELSLLIQKKEYAKILENEKLIQSTQAVGEDKYKLLFRRLSGDREQYKLAKQVMIDEYGSKVNKTFHLNALHALLANGEIKDAEIIAKKLVPLWYTRILNLKGDIKEIVNYGLESKDSRSASYVAYEYSKRFKKEDCVKWLEKVEIQDLDDRWLYYYTKAYVYGFGLDAAFDHVIDNIDSIQSNSRYQLYYALCPAFSSLASYLVGYKKENLKENFSLLKKFINKNLKDEELKSFYSKVSFNNGRISESKIRLIFDAALYLGDQEKLKSHRGEYLKYGRHKLREGKRLLLDEKYQEALDVLKTVKVKDTELKYCLYMRARCFEKLGQQENFEQTMNLLKNSPTWSYEINNELLEFLEDLGDKKMLAYLLGQFQYNTAGISSKILEKLILHNINIGDVDQAQFYCIKYYLSRSKNTLYLYPSFALQLYLNFLSVEFAKKLKEKKVKEAVTVAEKFLSISPHHYEFHVHAINSLEKNAYKKESAEYFEKYMKYYDKLVEQSPVNSTAMNDWAWSAALCNRSLDQAEKKARAAVKMAPKNANLLDTLAEVLYRKGQKDEAIKIQQQACLLVDPESYSSFRAKLSRFKGTLK